ncbi:MAG: sigma-54-dependent Fis family transcriptional regulator [Xanthomonadales bacterium]|nr:sigma-54 dependent transcriptional regulator [Gammaproteobacteria bacterium]NNK05353.1 sigma-54-dependent Fis family transcriptional regulator [Xanthomonadales bacterium]
MQHHVLVIDDEPDIRELLDLTLSRMGLTVTTAEDLAEARRALAMGKFSFCLTDMRLPDGNGLDLVREIVRDHPQLPAAVITAHGRVEDAVTALKIGAFDFVSKPVDLSILRKLVNTALKLRTEESETAGPDEQDDSPFADDMMDRLTGNSEAIRKCKDMIRKLARSQAPVMISGDSGSGKELAARLIHDLGPRVDQPFVPVNCGAIPTELMESEFFGHLKGSFTGAGTDKEGLFQAADGGTLLLDEVADLPLSMQVKLLRAIQEKAVLPVGARKEVPIDVRILSASHQLLRPLVDDGKFRSDLFFRLNVIELHMPGLDERREDIAELVERFLKEITEQWDESNPPVVLPDAMEALKNHNYTGNVRELINILQRAITMCEGNTIEADDLMLEQVSVKESEPSLTKRDEDQTLDTYIEDIEKKMLEDALKKARYNKTRAAELLGISFRSFRYKLKKFDID